MDHGHGPVLADVGMRITVVRRTMGRPAGVADTKTAGRGTISQVLGKIIDAAGPFAQVEMVPGHGGDAGAVVAAIFEPAKAFNQDWFRFPMPQITHDATHSRCLRKTLLAQVVPLRVLPGIAAIANSSFCRW